MTKIEKAMTGKENKKKHNTSINSTKCYNEISKEGLIEKESEVVLKIIASGPPITNRQVSNQSGIERGNICRVLFNLVRKGLIEIVYSAKCNTSNRTVGYYALSN